MGGGHSATAEPPERPCRETDDSVTILRIVLYHCHVRGSEVAPAGCTCVCGRASYDTWPSTVYPSTSKRTEISSRRRVYLDDELYLLHLVDLTRIRLYYAIDLEHSIFKSKLRISRGAVFVYSIASREMFEETKSLILQIKEQSMEQAYPFNPEITTLMLLGNKCDLPDDEREVDSATALKFAEDQGMLFYEVSAKDGTNIEVAFITLAAEIVRKLKLKH